MKLLRLHVLTLLFVFTVAADVQADEINYGDFIGNTVTYLDVTESSLDPIPLYGQPEIFGDTLHMPGTGFVTDSSDGEIDFLDGRLTFMIESNGGGTLSSVTIRENGTYSTLGEESIASVTGVAFAETLEGDLVFGKYSFVTFGSTDPDSGEWIREITLTFPTTTKVTISLDNQLFSFADTPGNAFINKTGIDITVGIPEPSAAALLTFGLMGLSFRSQRR